MPHLSYPLRGLAGEGAQAVVDRALGGLVGIQAARAEATAQILDVEYDAERITPSEIHEALRQAGIVHVADEPNRDHAVPSGDGTAQDEQDTLGRTIQGPMDRM